MIPTGYVGAILSLSLALSGCGTAVNGRTQKVAFTSNPPGATVFVDSKEVGITPVTANLIRSEIHSVRIEKSGYVPYEMTTVTVENNWSLADAVVPYIALPELFADHSLGGMYDLRPADVYAKLIAAADHSTSTTSPIPQSDARLTSPSDPNR